MPKWLPPSPGAKLGNPTDRSLDALLPAEIAERAETVGVQKTKLDVVSLLALAILAGAFIALGAMFATTVLAGADSDRSDCRMRRAEPPSIKPRNLIRLRHWKSE